MTEENLEFLKDKSWRMNNLYRVVDKTGNSVRFKLNEVQQDVLDNIHTRNLILKARQLGMSTFSVIYLLDEAIFNENTSAGIVSYSLEHAQHIFKRIIGHALDSLTPVAKQLAGIKQRSAREITFENGSYLRVDTTLRGGAYQLVLVSEFGKTCARNPLKAEEVITGTLQSVPLEGRIIIESTGEGNEGYYAEMVNHADQRGNEDLSSLDYKLFFYPWYLESNYQLNASVPYPVEMSDYFSKIEETQQIILTQSQKNWYAQQAGILGDKVKQEFPSTVKEAFLSSSDAYYYQQGIEKAFAENRMLSTSPYDPLEPVYVAMDIGATDLTVMIYFQVIHGEIRVLDFYADNNKGVDFYVHHLLQEKSYVYNTIFLPHDSKKKNGVIVENVYEREFRRLIQHTNTKVIVLKASDRNVGITNAMLKLNRTVFDVHRTKPLTDKLSRYRKKWSEQYGKYIDEPLHDISSHYADAFRYVMQGVNHIEAVGNHTGALEKHKQAVESRRIRF